MGDVRRQLHQPAAQPADADHTRERRRLAPQWTFQTDISGSRFETTPLYRDNVLYVTGPLNAAWAIDARTGREIWRYRRELPPTGSLTACCGLVNKGFGVLGDRLFMTTLDAHVVALDMKTGAVVWDVAMEDYRQGYASTIAPLVVKDKVIVGVAGGEYGIRGFIDAYDAKTGKRAWRFYTIPGPGEPGNDTWAGDSWQRGGASVWVTGAYDPELNLLYYGIGNPGPDYHGDSRKGDNLYSDSIVALDADTGRLRWHYQFTPHDLHDWDATEVPVLGDLTVAGQPRKVVMFANRNGFYLHARPHEWEDHRRQAIRGDHVGEGNRSGRPPRAPSWPCAGREGRNHLSRRDWRDQLLASATIPRSVSSSSTRARSAPPTMRGGRSMCRRAVTGGAGQRARGPEFRAYGALRAIDPVTGDRRWEFESSHRRRQGCCRRRLA